MAFAVDSSINSYLLIEHRNCLLEMLNGLHCIWDGLGTNAHDLPVWKKEIMGRFLALHHQGWKLLGFVLATFIIYGKIQVIKISLKFDKIANHDILNYNLMFVDILNSCNYGYHTLSDIMHLFQSLATSDQELPRFVDCNIPIIWL